MGKFNFGDLAQAGAQQGLNMLTGGLSNMFSNFLSGNQMERQNKLQMQNWRETFAAENKRQDQLMLNSARMLKQGLKNAGLSPALMNGGTFSESVSSGQTGSAASPFSFQGINPVDLATIQNVNADTEGKNIDNAHKDQLLNDQHAMNEISMAAQQIQSSILQHQDQREQEKQKYVISQLSNDIDLQNLSKDTANLKNNLDRLMIDAMNKEYDYNGHKVKGSEIANFKEIFATELAIKANGIAAYNAQTSRMALDKDPLAVVTREFLAPFAAWLKEQFNEPSEADSILKNGLEDILQAIDHALDPDYVDGVTEAGRQSNPKPSYETPKPKKKFTFGKGLVEYHMKSKHPKAYRLQQMRRRKKE